MKFLPNVCNNPANPHMQTKPQRFVNKVMCNNEKWGKVLSKLTEMYLLCCTKACVGDDGFKMPPVWKTALLRCDFGHVSESSKVKHHSPLFDPHYWS